MIISDLLRDHQLRTFYQPIASFQGQDLTIYGYEALTRGPEGSRFENAETLFHTAERRNRLYDLERVARRNAIKQFVRRFDDEFLFLNVDPNVIYDDSFRSGNTINYVDEFGLKQNQIIFEITEQNRIRDRNSFEKSVQHYRDQGFKIAVDDVGSGYSNLDKIARLQPDFIKIDRNIVRELYLNRPQLQLVKTIVDFSDRIGSDVIAEGVETKEELQTLLSVGVDYAQGYFISRPASVPDRIGESVFEIYRHSLESTRGQSSSPKLGELARPRQTFGPDVLTNEVFQYLREAPDQQSIVIVKNQKPVGLIMRNQLHEKLSTNIGQSLYSNRPVKNIIEEDPLIVPSDAPIHKASEVVTSRSDDHFHDDVIVVDPDSHHYLGNVTVRQLLKEVTQLKTKKARRANPLTGLPGNVEIQNRIQDRLNGDEEFALVYADLDHFKPFNDYYGFERGDQAILLEKEILNDALNIYDHPRNFLGHVGGDDFVVLIPLQNVRDYCEYVIQQFDQRIKQLYDPEDLETGTIETSNREGNVCEFNVMTITLAVVTNENRTFESHLGMSQVAAEVKKYAKQNRDKSTFEIDRRG